MARSAGRGAILFASLCPIVYENRYVTSSLVYIASKKQYSAEEKVILAANARQKCRNKG